MTWSARVHLAKAFLLLCLGAGCGTAATPSSPQSPRAARPVDVLPDEGPRSCVDQAVARVRNALPERELPIRTSGIVYGAERPCILDEQTLDYFSLPLLDTPSPHPWSDSQDVGLGSWDQKNFRADVVAMDGAGRDRDAMQLLYSSGRPSSDPPQTVAGTAPAIVPATLYAFRHCSWGCAPDDHRPRVEELVVVGPIAAWTSSSDDDGSPRPELKRRSTFSFVSAGIWEGSSATLGFVVAPENLVSFGAMKESEIDRAFPGPEDVARYAAYTIDVVWPRDGKPELTLHRGEVIAPTGAAATAPAFR